MELGSHRPGPSTTRSCRRSLDSAGALADRLLPEGMPRSSDAARRARSPGAGVRLSKAELGIPTQELIRSYETRLFTVNNTVNNGFAACWMPSAAPKRPHVGGRHRATRPRRCGRGARPGRRPLRDKKFARHSDDNVALLADAVWERLAADKLRHRLVALDVCAELWPRSTAFRRSLLEHMVPDFVQAVGGDRRHPLPDEDDRSAARALRSRALELVGAWHASHGHREGYRDLGLARRYLRAQASAARANPVRRDGGGEVAAVPLAAAAARRPVCRRSASSDGAERYAEVQASSSATIVEIRRCVETIEECMHILAPSLDVTTRGGDQGAEAVEEAAVEEDGGKGESGVQGAASEAGDHSAGGNEEEDDGDGDE